MLSRVLELTDSLKIYKQNTWRPLCLLFDASNFLPTLVMCLYFFSVLCVIHLVSWVLLLGLLLVLKLSNVCKKYGKKKINFYSLIFQCNQWALVIMLWELGSTNLSYKHQAVLRTLPPFRCWVINLQPNLLALVCRECYNKIPQTGWLKQQNCIFSTSGA